MAAISGNPFHDLGMTIQGTPFRIHIHQSMIITSVDVDSDAESKVFGEATMQADVPFYYKALLPLYWHGENQSLGDCQTNYIFLEK